MLLGGALFLGALALAPGCDRTPGEGEDHPPRAPSVEGPRGSAQRDAFAFERPSSEVAVGERAIISFKVLPKGKYKINPEYPWKAHVYKAQSSPGLDLPSENITRGEMAITDASVTISIPVEASSAGAHELMASVNLSVCEKGDEARCLWFTKEPVTLKVTAK